MRIQNSIKLPLICREFHSNEPFRQLPFLTTFTSHRSIKLPLLFLRTSLHLLHILPVSRHITTLNVRPGHFTNSIKLIQHPPRLHIIQIFLTSRNSSSKPISACPLISINSILKLSDSLRKVPNNLLSLFILRVQPPAIRFSRLPSSYYNCILTPFSLSSLESLPLFLFRLHTLLF